MCYDMRIKLGIGDMFNMQELRQRILASVGIGTHTLTVRKPFCCPAHDIIRNALEPYGVKIIRQGETTMQANLRDVARMMKVEFKTFENLKYGPIAIMWLPIAIQSTVTVPKAQAGWAEYLLERTGRLVVVGGRVNSRNREWADRHNGRMPVAWQDSQAARIMGIDKKIMAEIERGRPWLESGCKAGHGQWGTVNQAAKKASQNHK